HYAIALGWSRAAGEAPVCLAKGVDEIAAAIRKTAQESGVPIHQDPPTARALYSTVSLGQEIPEDKYRAVAAAIRFAEKMRIRAKAGA
ncbi:MAG: EscU/YscU/HrcU family type III secretion system export apparatus switch protein, partial [Paracoccaceae bacterium]